MKNWPENRVLYREEQTFRSQQSLVVWGVAFGTFVLMLALFGPAVLDYVKCLLSGARPEHPVGFVVSGAIAVVLCLGIWLVLLSLTLTTEVREDGVHVGFVPRVPFGRRSILFGSISKCYAREYSPLREFGGWGIRFGARGDAFNVGGDQGVQLELHSGRPLLIGSLRPDGLRTQSTRS